MTLLSWAGIVAIVAAFLLVAIAYRLLAPRSIRHADAEWFRGFHPERYQPMLRILDSSEFRFLARQPGVTRQLLRELRLRRIGVLNGYLRSMRNDFDRLQALGRVLIGAGLADRAMADALMQSKLTFTRAWWGLRLRLVLYRWGLAPVDATKLVNTLGSLDRTLRAPIGA